MLTVLHELMKKGLEMTDKDLFLIIKLTVYPSCPSEKKIEKKELKKVFEIYDLEYILFLNLQYIILRIKAAVSRWKFLP